jgi:TPR repeat protein
MNDPGHPVWPTIDDIRREWPYDALDADADRAAWEEGIGLYERDDYPSMMQCAELLSRALAHHLYGPGLITGSDYPNTVFKVLYASVEAPPDGQTFADSAQRCARLALTLTRDNGWQPADLGGLATFPPLLDEVGNRMLYSAALAPPGQPVGNLHAFFAVPAEDRSLVLRRDTTPSARVLTDAIARAEAGDVVEGLRIAAVVAESEGDIRRAYDLTAAAAEHGDVDSMVHAGILAERLGLPSETRAWAQRAAGAGSAVGMFNFGLALLNEGDLQAARSWLEAAATAGNAEGYAALIEVAERQGDTESAERFASAGAALDNPRSLQMHANYVMRKDPDAVSAYLPTLERAAELGNDAAMLQAGIVCHHIGDDARSSYWLHRAQEAGNPGGAEKLGEYGLT